MMKKYLALVSIFAVPVIVFIGLWYSVKNEKPIDTQVSIEQGTVDETTLGDSNINPLNTWTSSTSPVSAITQRQYGRDVRITGLESCDTIDTDSNGVLVCGSDASGGGSGGGLGTTTPWTTGQVAYVVNNGTVTSVATSTIGAGTGLTFSGTSGYQIGGTNGTFSVNTSQNIATLSNLTSNGLVYTAGGAGTLNVVATSTLTASSPLTGSFTQVGTGGAIGCQTASGSQAGCLSSTDWTTFNNKSGFAFPWTVNTGYNSTTTTIGFINGGLFSTASSTFSSALRLTSLSQGSLYIGSTGLVNTVATSTPSVSAPITYSGTLGQFLGGSSGSFGCTNASSGVTGCLTGTDWNTFNGKENALTFNYPLSRSANTISFSGLGTTTTWTAGQVPYVVNGNTLTGLSTSTPTIGASLSYTGTMGNVFGGSSGTLSLNMGNANTWTALQTFTNSSTTLGSFNYASSTQYFGAGLGTCNGSNFLQWSGGVFGCGTPAGAGTVTSVVAGVGFQNRGLNITSSGTLNVGIATSSNPTLGHIPYWTGVGDASNSATIGSVATSSLAVNGSISSSGTLGYQIGGSNTTLSLNMANANSWTALQSFVYSSTTGQATFANASSTQWVGGGLQTCDPTTGKLTWNSSTLQFGCGTDFNTGGGSDFTFETTMGSLTSATSSKVWFKDQIIASSSIQFNTNLISEHSSLRFLDIQGRAGGDYTLARIKAPRTTPYESTLALLIDESGDNSGVNESFFDLYNENYSDSYQAGFRLVNTGTARAKPIVIGHYDDDGMTKDQGNKITLFPSGTVWLGQGTSTASLTTQLHVSSTTATNLFELDGTTGDRFVVTQATSTFRGALAVGTTTVSGTNTQATFSVKGIMNVIVQFFTSTGTKIMEITDAGIATLLGIWNFGGATVTGLPYYPAFTYATSTAWTATTTIPLGVAYNAQTWRGVKCFTDTGTLNVSFYDGTNRMNMFNASTTVGTVTLSTNNTFTASEKRYVDVGTPASSPTKISCTVSFQDN